MRRYLGLVLCLLAGSVLAETRYVTDQLSIMVRRGQGTEFAILAQVKSGTALEVLETAKGYVKVRTPKGTEGWVIERYLLDRPVARDRLQSLQGELAQAQTSHTQLEAQIAALRESEAALLAERDALLSQSAELSAELADIRAAAASALEVREQKEQLQHQVRGLNLQIKDLTQAAEHQSARRDFLMLGAGVLFVGVLLGLLVPHLGRRKDPSW